MLRTVQLAAAVAALAVPALAEPAPAARGERVAAAAAGQAADGPRTDARAEDAERVFVRFRELFDGRGKASDRAVELNGRRVEMIGFQTPAPTRQSPFLVVVGAPSVVCPYCSSVDDREHLPYVLVYPETEMPNVNPRLRLRIVGEISASHQHESYYGLHNDVRILNATVLPDQRYRNPVRDRIAGRGAAEAAGAERADD